MAMRSCALILALTVLAADARTDRADAGAIEVKVGATVGRTWEQVKADKYAYGPKQEHDAGSDETHIYLPYGKNPKLYDEVSGVLSDPAPGSPALFNSASGDDNAVLTFKLHFDQRIGTLRFSAGWTELGLAKNTVAGVEYSEDGRQWKTIREIKGFGEEGAAIVEPLVKDFKADGPEHRHAIPSPVQPRPPDPAGFRPRQVAESAAVGRPELGRRGHDLFFQSAPGLGGAGQARHACPRQAGRDAEG